MHGGREEPSLLPPDSPSRDRGGRGRQRDGNGGKGRGNGGREIGRESGHYHITDQITFLPLLPLPLPPPPPPLSFLFPFSAFFRIFVLMPKSFFLPSCLFMFLSPACQILLCHDVLFRFALILSSFLLLSFFLFFFSMEQERAWQALFLPCCHHTRGRHGRQVGKGGFSSSSPFYMVSSSPCLHQPFSAFRSVIFFSSFLPAFLFQVFLCR